MATTCRITHYSQRPYFVVPCKIIDNAWFMLMEEPGFEGPPSTMREQKLPRNEFAIALDEEWHSTVGERFRGMDGVYRCTSYDSRCGFWMQNEADPKDWRNVSERAIGRTFHRIYNLEER